MPSTSKKQHNFMSAIANNPSFAKKVGIPQSVGKEFSAADKGRKFEKGGATMMNKKVPMKSGSKGGMPPAAKTAMMARRRMSPSMPPPIDPGMGAGMPPPAMPAQPPMGMKKGGMHKMPDGKMMKDSAMKMRGMKDGGMAMVKKGGKMVPDFAADGKGKMKTGGMAGMKKMMGGGMAGYAKGGGIESSGKTKGTIIRMASGGSVSARADGIAQRGKTKFKMC